MDRDRAKGHFDAAANMTDAIGGLTALTLLGGAETDAALETFYARWRDEPLVVDKWFAVQALDPGAGALGRVLGLTTHPAFDARNPNRLRSLGRRLREQQPGPLPRSQRRRLPVSRRPDPLGG